MSIECRNVNYVYQAGTPMETHVLTDVNLTIGKEANSSGSSGIRGPENPR